jgi:large subunit ribosomal protein L30
MGSEKGKSKAPQTLRITLIKGLAGKKVSHKKTIRALGLKKVGSSIIKKNSPQIEGMVTQVSHMVRIAVEEKT